MEPDFPAAHSMDSCWFAVDRDGFVAYFSTGEAGAMPETGYQGEEASGLEDILIRDLPVGDVLHDPNGHRLPDQTTDPFGLLRPMTGDDRLSQQPRPGTDGYRGRAGDRRASDRRLRGHFSRDCPRNRSAG